MILIPVFFGCETSEDIGIKYDLGTDASVKFQEFTLPATNLYIDSLRTDGETRVLVGNYSNPITGTVSAEGYLQYFYEKGPMPRQRDEDDQIFLDTLKLDSIVVVLETNAIVPQQGTSFQEFSVYDLEDSLINSAIYLASLQQTPRTLAGSFSGSINTEVDTLYRIKLENGYAQSFFNNVSNIAGDPDKSIATTVFRSMGFIPGSSAESIASINLASDTTRIIMYTSPVSPGAKDTTYLTYFRFNGKHYSYLNRDRSGSEFAAINEFEDFDLTSGETIIDPIAGIKTAISIAGIEDFFDQNRNILINNATLSMDFESETERDTLTRFMNFFRKQDGRIFGPATADNPFGNIIMSDNGYLSAQSDPATSSLNDTKNKIILSSTLFYQQFYQEFLERDSLVYQNPTRGTLIPIDDLVTISTADVTLQRTIFKNNGIKLRLYYTEVER
ncbi:DUF4270 family protein [Ekhidna sp.]|uniref:DUF4270 family protein n=1 Tax=Ekhidna sp. TaxID=2608089 RepID=UPI0032985424